jgi:hypothetical protein
MGPELALLIRVWVYMKGENRAGWLESEQIAVFSFARCEFLLPTYISVGIME